MHWDVFCRVIDNHGDIGVCWRLAADLARRGHAVRLWVDDPSSLDFMAPAGAPGVTVLRWQPPLPEDAWPGEVVVEAFGCDPPPQFVERMALRRPVWINLEYLSAEDYVERSHGLPSPQRNGLTKWFFYPGFTPRTGGLLREPGLMAEHAGFDRTAWLRARRIEIEPGERLVSLFCYDNPALPHLLNALAAEPTLLLAPGAAQRAVLPRLDAAGRIGALRALPLPFLTQASYDRLLWSCDLNFVRGEDSFVRAQWAGAPFVWQIYPQHDGVHAAKLEAFLERCQAPAAVRELMRAWNGLALWPAAWPPSADWAAACRAWREKLLAQDDLSTQLLGFVAAKRLE
jgi:uncharacterized repeat protein (TIGR03837 family)